MATLKQQLLSSLRNKTRLCRTRTQAVGNKLVLEKLLLPLWPLQEVEHWVVELSPPLLLPRRPRHLRAAPRPKRSLRLWVISREETLTIHRTTIGRTTRISSPEVRNQDWQFRTQMISRRRFSRRLGGKLSECLRSDAWKWILIHECIELNPHPLTTLPRANHSSLALRAPSAATMLQAG